MATGDRDALAPFYDLYAPRRPEHRSSRGLNRLLDRGLRGAPKGGLRMSDFVSDVAAIRRRARQHIEKGPVTGGYKADLPRVIAVLNEVLATEIVCVLRYKRHYFTADGINAQPVAQEFLQHANEEQQHADWVAQRIVDLWVLNVGMQSFLGEYLVDWSSLMAVGMLSLAPVFVLFLLLEPFLVSGMTQGAVAN